MIRGRELWKLSDAQRKINPISSAKPPPFSFSRLNLADGKKFRFIPCAPSSASLFGLQFHRTYNLQKWTGSKMVLRGFTGGPVVKTVLPRQAATVQSLVGELRSHKLGSTVKKQISFRTNKQPFSKNWLWGLHTCITLYERKVELLGERSS